MDFDPVLLSRIQFAFTVSFHIIFPAFTIGLASWLAMLEWRYLRTGDERFMTIYNFWVKIFAVAFGMGVVSGLVMSYQFGTNWSGFSDAIGSVMGPLMGYEVLTAFFLEASFLGIMLFGRDKVGPNLHFFSTLMVAVGTLISSFWILSANSWMHTPAGHSFDGTLFTPENWVEIIFNPSLPYRFAHMVMAAYLTTSFAVIGVASWFMLKKRHQDLATIMLNYGLWFILIVAPLQLLVGHEHGVNTLEYQPAKIAAMEGNWETDTGVPLLLVAFPDREIQGNHFEIGVPKLASWFVTGDMDGEVPGLKDWERDDQPPVAWVFWSFRVMVGIGMLMILTAVLGLVLRPKGRVYESKWFQRLCVAMGPSGFVAVLAGWFVTEIGRQPYVVYGILRTADMASPVPGPKVALSLAIFIVVYTIVFGAGTYYIFKLIGKGPVGDTAKAVERGDIGVARHPLGYTEE